MKRVRKRFAVFGPPVEDCSRRLEFLRDPPQILDAKISWIAERNNTQRPLIIRDGTLRVPHPTSGPGNAELMEIQAEYVSRRLRFISRWRCRKHFLKPHYLVTVSRNYHRLANPGGRGLS